MLIKRNTSCTLGGELRVIYMTKHILPPLFALLATCDHLLHFDELIDCIL